MRIDWGRYLTPLAVFSLISNTISKYGSVFLGVGVKYILTAYLCVLVSLIVVMIIPVSIIGKMSPMTFVKKIYKR